MVYLPSATASVYTKRQQNVLDLLSSEISRIGINVVINPSDVGQFKSKMVSLDVEHDESGGFVGCGLCYNDRDCYYFSDLSLLQHIDFPSLAIIAHNGVSDIECLRTWGINVQDSQLIWDTMLIGHILDSSLKSYNLKSMAERELQISYPSYDQIVGERGLKTGRITLDKQPMELVALYNSLDVYCTRELFNKQSQNGYYLNESL